MRISVGQFGPVADVEENLAAMRRLAARAAQEGADLLVLPEEAMLGAREVGEDFPAVVAAAWAPFTAGIAALAAEHGIAVIAGGYEPSATDRPYNTLVAVDASGAGLARYRKLHLYDAFAHRESERITPGDGGVAAIELGGLRLGLLTCYDLRFPELARRLAVEGAEVLVVPAAWFSGEHKVDHWRTLLKARAVENTVWVVAADTCSDGTVGHSMIVDPLALPVAELAEEREDLATAEVTRERIDEVRVFLPVLADRRADVL